MTVLYIAQPFGRARAQAGVIIGISLRQIGIPLASVIGPPLIDLGEPGVFYQLETSLALLTLGAIFAVRFPHALRVDAFTRGDIPVLLTVTPRSVEINA